MCLSPGFWGSQRSSMPPPISAPTSGRCPPCVSVSVRPKFSLLIRTLDLVDLVSSLTQYDLILVG